MKRHPNFELCAAVMRMPDGSLSTKDLENQAKLAWSDFYQINAKPERMKLCMRCHRNLPVAHYLTDGLARTILREDYYGDMMAWVVANVRMWCEECEG